MAVIVYLGGAKDHAVSPQVYGRGQSGKPDKRMRLVKEASTSFTEMQTFVLRGVSFPKGEPVEVKDKDLIAKAKALKFFEIRDVALQVEEEKEAPKSMVAEAVETIKRRGRPRKVSED